MIPHRTDGGIQDVDSFFRNRSEEFCGWLFGLFKEVVHWGTQVEIPYLFLRFLLVNHAEVTRESRLRSQRRNVPSRQIPS